MRQLIVITFVLCSCTTLKVTSLCESEGTVILLDELDGCKWLIETADGRKLLPQNSDDYNLADGQRIHFSYIPFEGMSICMVEDEIVTLTCYQLHTERKCNNERDWKAISWLSDIIENQPIKQVDCFASGNEKVYQITRTDGSFAWYHCDGMLICDSENGCSVSTKVMTDQVTVFLAHR